MMYRKEHEPSDQKCTSVIRRNHGNSNLTRCTLFTFHSLHWLFQLRILLAWPKILLIRDIIQKYMMFRKSYEDGAAAQYLK